MLAETTAPVEAPVARGNHRPVSPLLAMEEAPVGDHTGDAAPAADHTDDDILAMEEAPAAGHTAPAQDEDTPDRACRPPPWYLPRRVITTVMLFLGLAVVYALRVCISIAAAPGVTASNTTSPRGAARNDTAMTMYSEFQWTNTDQVYPVMRGIFLCNPSFVLLV